MELQTPPTDPSDEPFPNEPTVDDPGLEMPGEDPGAVDAPADPDSDGGAVRLASDTPLNR